MLHLSDIRTYPDVIKESLRIRGLQDADALLDRVLKADKRYGAAKTKYDLLRQDIKSKGEEMAVLRRKKENPDREAQLYRSLSDLKKERKSFQRELREAEEDLFKAAQVLPNILLEAPKVWQPRKSKGIKEQKDSIQKRLPHWDWLTQAGWVDFEKGAEVTGSGFVFFKDKGARLVRALIQFFLDRAVAAGYTEVHPPLLVNEAAAFGTGQLPDKEGQMYQLKDDTYYLIPTGEVPITNLYRNTIIDYKDLPIKLVGYTPCFRREAGAWGTQIRGLNRLHQFDKVEIVQIIGVKDLKNLEDSKKVFDALKEMQDHIGDLLDDLGLPFRTVLVEPKDLGFAAAWTSDFEVWAGHQERWLEVSSLSFFGEFQALRMNLRYKDKEGKLEYPATYNASALALPRVIAALVENNQHEGGRLLRLPAVLKDYLGKDFGEDKGKDGIEVELPLTATGKALKKNK